MRKNPDKNFVASLQKGLEALTCFGRQHHRLTVSQVALLTSASPASARRSLLTLQSHEEFHWCWQDGARLMAFIENARLHARDFSHLQVDCG